MHVRDNLFIMVNATIPDPIFDGQYTTAVTKFGCDVSDALVERLVKNTHTCSVLRASEPGARERPSRRQSGPSNVVRVVKLNDANPAGTKDLYWAHASPH
jgi:hypothetical protein